MVELLGFGWDGVEGAAEVAFAEADVGVGVVGDFDAEGVHAGGGCVVTPQRTRFAGGPAFGFGVGLEAEQVVVVDVVGELVEAVVEALLAGEVDVFAAGERGKLVGRVLLEGVDGHDEKADGAAASTVLEVVEDLGFAGAEGYGVDDGVGAAELGDDFGGFDFAAVVAGFADEKDGVAVMVFAGIEEIGGEGYGVEGGGGGVVAGVELGEGGGHGAGVGGEVAEERGGGAVGDDGDLAGGVSGHGVDHGGEAAELGELHGGGAAALDDDGEREAEGVGVFVEVDGLGDAVVFDDELVGFKAVEDFAVFGLDGGGDEHDVRLGAEGEVLSVLRRCRGREQEREDGELR